MKNSLTFIAALVVVLISTGCETWQGAKEDTAKGAQWSKEKINDGAKYVEEKSD